MTTEEKIQMALQLARLGVDVIEAGFAAASKGDFEAVKLITEEVKGPVICSLARALEKDIELAAQALEGAERKRIHTFIATSEIHMKYKLRLSPEEVLERAERAVAFARRFTDDVEFSCWVAASAPWALAAALRARPPAGRARPSPLYIKKALASKWYVCVAAAAPSGGHAHLLLTSRRPLT